MIADDTSGQKQFQSKPTSTDDFISGDVMENTEIFLNIVMMSL